MKTTSLFAIAALLGATDSTQTVKSLLERAQEDDDISSGKIDIGHTYVDISEHKAKKTHKHKKHHHHQAKESSLVQSEPAVTNEARPLDEVRQSSDETGGDQSDRKTDIMTPHDQTYEDNFYQGSQTGEPNTGTKNAPGIGDHSPLPVHRVEEIRDGIPKAWDKMGPTNMPDHKQAGDFEVASKVGASSTGIYLVYLTVDSEEHASRFVKDLFKSGMVAAVEMTESGFDRSYLKFGRISTEKGRTRLQMTTSASRVTELINYINNENPTPYDYPVPNTTVLAVENANEGYVRWVKSQTSSDDGKIKYDLGSKDNLPQA